MTGRQAVQNFRIWTLQAKTTLKKGWKVLITKHSRSILGKMPMGNIWPVWTSILVNNIFLQLYRQRAQVVYEQIVDEACPSWISLIDNEGSLSNCFTAICKPPLSLQLFSCLFTFESFNRKRWTFKKKSINLRRHFDRFLWNHATSWLVCFWFSGETFNFQA